eukprot:Nk52_evm1s1063 gene=Nk52_evmTU1s1063
MVRLDVNVRQGGQSEGAKILKEILTAIRNGDFDRGQYEKLKRNVIAGGGCVDAAWDDALRLFAKKQNALAKGGTLCFMYSHAIRKLKWNLRSAKISPVGRCKIVLQWQNRNNCWIIGEPGGPCVVWKVNCNILGQFCRIFRISIFNPNNFSVKRRLVWEENVLARQSRRTLNEFRQRYQ